MNTPSGSSIERLEHAVTRQRLIIHPEVPGGPLVIDVTDPPRSSTPLHVHPVQEESFTVTSGALTVLLPGRSVTLGPGQSITIPAGVAHAIVTSASETTQMRWETSPPGSTRQLMRTLCDLAQARAAGGSRLQHLLGQATAIRRHARDLSILRPGRFVQALMVKLAGWLGADRAEKGVGS